MNEVEAVKLGSSSAIGGFLGWFIAYLKGKDTDKKIAERRHVDTCNERHKAVDDKNKAVDDWRMEMNLKYDRFDEKLDDIKNLILKKGIA